MTPAKKMTKARSGLVLSHPFFGSLALRLRIEESPGIGTMATDGERLAYDPAFVDELGMPELMGVVAHEVMHCAVCHHTRRGDRDAKRWNVAGDLAINPLLIDAGIVLPDDALIEDRFRGMSAEAIYAALGADQTAAGDSQQSQAPSAGGSQPSDAAKPSDGHMNDAVQRTACDGGMPDPGRCGAVVDAPATTPAETKQAEREWQVAVTQAAQAAKKAGKLPGSLKELVDEIKEPRADWRALLRRFADQIRPTDYRWVPPNRRHVAQGLYLPSLGEPNVGEIVIAVDTSGSIDRAMLAQFGAECRAILEDLGPPLTTVIYADKTVHRVERFENATDFELEAVGRGGTDLRAPFAWIEENGIQPAAMVYLTDLVGPMPDFVAFPVVWAVYGNDAVAPFGETVHLTTPAGC